MKIFHVKLNIASSEHKTHNDKQWNSNAPKIDFIKKKCDHMSILSGTTSIK